MKVHIFFRNFPIAWKTKKQQSLTEDEYRSIAITCSELKLLKGWMITLLVVMHPELTKLYCDSQAALHIATNPTFHERTKHNEIDCHFVHTEITLGHISTHYVATRDQLTNILITKALGKPRFEYLLGKSGIRDLHAPT